MENCGIVSHSPKQGTACGATACGGSQPLAWTAQQRGRHLRRGGHECQAIRELANAQKPGTCHTLIHVLALLPACMQTEPVLMLLNEPSDPCISSQGLPVLVVNPTCRARAEPSLCRMKCKDLATYENANVRGWQGGEQASTSGMKGCCHSLGQVAF